MQFTRATQLDPDLWQIDLAFQGKPGVIAAFLITGPYGHTLIETGPGSTLAALEAGVEAAGARLGDISQILVSHIHLDHAGAAGSLLRRLPDARLYVHPRGAKHMVDPSKLIASATRIYAERMDSLWGAFEACPADRVVVLEDHAELACGRRTLAALHTPGHAIHHIAFHDAERGSVFTGDVGGVRLQGASYVRPPTPPPDIDLEAWTASVDRIRALKPQTLELTHFGRFTDPARHLDELMRRLDEWTSWVGERVAEGRSSEAMAAALQLRADGEVAALGGSAELQVGYELASPSGMTVDGLVRYLGRSA